MIVVTVRKSDVHGYVIVTKFSCLYADGNGGEFTQGGCAFPHHIEARGWVRSP